MPLTVWLYALLVVCSSHGARIIGIFPSPSISHQLPYQAVMKALASRGHQVTVISPEPLKTPHANYTDIDLSFSYAYLKRTRNFNSWLSFTPYQTLYAQQELSQDLAHLQLSSYNLKNFIKSNQTFELAFIECISYQSYYGLIHHVGSPPIIGILSMGATDHEYDLVANPNNPAYDPDFHWPYGDRMTFWQRLNTMVFNVWSRYMLASTFIPAQEKIMRQYFGNGPPSIVETEKNFSLVMVNNHWTLSYPRPLMPNFIELGNLHLKTGTNPLPKDIATFLDGAVDGFIYFSLGSNVRSDQLSVEKRQHFLEAFAALPQRVLWKWESEEMPGKPQNVKLGKWLPQWDILAHPNIRLFITQGGLQSLGEAVQNSVPMVAIPFMFDQGYNGQRIVSAGIGVKLDFHEATTDSILKALKAVLYEPSYRENMQKFSAIAKDQPETPLQRAVWWTEYVLRHKGAKHMRSGALDLAWYQYLLLDVIAFLTASAAILFTLLYFMLRKCTRLVSNLSGANKVKNI